MQNPKNSRDSARWPITISSTSSTSPPRLIIPAPTPTAVHTSNRYPPPQLVPTPPPPGGAFPPDSPGQARPRRRRRGGREEEGEQGKCEEKECRHRGGFVRRWRAKKSGSTVLLNEQRGCDRDRRMP